MTDYVLSIDCGVSTGIALLSYEEDSPAELVEGWQFGGGVTGLLDWVNDHFTHSSGIPGFVSHGDREESVWVYQKGLLVLAEKFTARNTRGFSYTTASLEPLRGEGALIALGLMPDYTVAEKRWRDPGLQYFSGGSGKAERKKRQHAFLKANGFYKTGKDFGTADADDYRSAAAHGIAYIARELKHKPTWSMISAWGEGN